MIVEKQIECRLAGETKLLGENLPQRHFCPSQNPKWQYQKIAADLLKIFRFFPISTFRYGYFENSYRPSRVPEALTFLASEVKKLLTYDTWSQVLGLMWMKLFMFVLTLANDLYYNWFIYPILCWCWCPVSGNSSIDWTQLSMFLPEDGVRIQYPRRCVLNKNMTMGDDRK
jgi:hypothetical protein